MRRQERKQILKSVYCFLLFMTITICVGCGMKPKDEEVSEQAMTEQPVDAEQSGEESGESQKTEESVKEEESNTLKFPYELENGKLEITSLFQSDVPNPDKDFEEAKNLATIEVLNKSDHYLAHADIVLVLEDGTQTKFRIEDIPSGKKVWAFDLENTTMVVEGGCVSAVCTAEFSEEISDWSTNLQIEASASMATIVNLTDETLTDLQLTFHCVMEDTYFGGKSYQYSIDEILPKDSNVLTVTECYFGDAEVVRVEP